MFFGFCGFNMGFNVGFSSLKVLFLSTIFTLDFLFFEPSLKNPFLLFNFSRFVKTASLETASNRVVSKPIKSIVISTSFSKFSFATTVFILIFTFEKATIVLATCRFTSPDFIAAISVKSANRKASLYKMFMRAFIAGVLKRSSRSLSIRSFTRSFNSIALLNASLGVIFRYFTKKESTAFNASQSFTSAAYCGFTFSVAL